MIKARRAGWLLIPFVLGTCEESKPEPTVTPAPALDVRLAAGEVRAGATINEAALLTGPTAKGRVGDYKLYNDKVAFIIASDSRAGGFGFNPYAGTIVDADRVHADGEPGTSTFGEVIVAVDLSVLSPTEIEVVNDGTDGSAARIRVHGAEAPLPLLDVLLSKLLERETHEIDFDVEYVLEPDAEWLQIDYILHNRGKAFVELGAPMSVFMFGDGAQPFLPGYGYVQVDSGSTGSYYGAIADDISYIYGRPDRRLEVVLNRSGIVVGVHGREKQLRGGETFTFSHVLAVGDGDLAATQKLWRRASNVPEPPTLSGEVAYPDGSPVANARVHVLDAVRVERDYITTTRTDAAGRWQASLPSGTYLVSATLVGHRTTEPVTATVESGNAAMTLQMDPPGFIQYAITDDRGQPLPAKLTVKPQQGGVERPPGRFGAGPEPSGVLHTEYNVTGSGRFALPPGDHEVWVSRGGEYTVVEQAVTVAPGATAQVTASLSRVVDTTGWMSTDTHVHAQLSPDSPDLYPFKVSAMVVEGLELPISTEHEAIGDFNPAIKALGLEAWMKGVIGSEITTYTYGHFNAWPLVQDLAAPGNGRIDWYYKDPAETFAAIRANAGKPFIQVNHPRAPAVGGYFSAMGLDPTTATASRDDVWSTDFDGIEVANGCGIGHIENETMPDWFGFLNAGVRKWAVGSTDSHKAGHGQLGYPRTYVAMPTDDPAVAKIDDFSAAMKAGKMIITCGPFFTVTVNGVGVGETATVNGAEVIARVKVQAPPYMDIDTIELVYDGTVVEQIDVPASTDVVRFDGDIPMAVNAGIDSWMIVRVRGGDSHSGWASRRPSYAFSNPIFLDMDGDGTWSR